MTAILHAIALTFAAWFALSFLTIGLWALIPKHRDPVVVVVPPLRLVSVEEALGAIAADEAEEAEEWLRDFTNTQIVEEWRGEVEGA